MTLQRFTLEWLLPLEPGLPTYVTLHDRGAPRDSGEAMGHGADEEEALLDLWTKLVERQDATEAIDYVAAAYERRAKKLPERPL